MSYLMGAISGCLLVIGTAAVLVTAPKYSYPITVGGGCFFGFMVNSHCVPPPFSVVSSNTDLSNVALD